MVIAVGINLPMQTSGYCFPNARHTIDRFHVQKLALETVQQMRIEHRWDAIQQDTDERENAKLKGRHYEPEKLANGDTLKELLARSRYLLFKSPDSSPLFPATFTIGSLSEKENKIKVEDEGNESEIRREPNKIRENGHIFEVQKH